MRKERLGTTVLQGEILYTNLSIKYCCIVKVWLSNHHLGSRNRLFYFALILVGKIVSIFERPLGTDYIQKPRYHCILFSNLCLVKVFACIESVRLCLCTVFIQYCIVTAHCFCCILTNEFNSTLYTLTLSAS